MMRHGTRNCSEIQNRGELKNCSGCWQRSFETFAAVMMTMKLRLLLLLREELTLMLVWREQRHRKRNHWRRFLKLQLSVEVLGFSTIREGKPKKSLRNTKIVMICTASPNVSQKYIILSDVSASIKPGRFVCFLSACICSSILANFVLTWASRSHNVLWESLSHAIRWHPIPTWHCWFFWNFFCWWLARWHYFSDHQVQERQPSC